MSFGGSAGGKSGTSMGMRFAPSAAIMLSIPSDRSSDVTVSGTAADSPGPSTNTRLVAGSNFTPGVALSHWMTVVAERAAPLFQNFTRSFTGAPAVAHTASAISYPDTAIAGSADIPTS